MPSTNLTCTKDARFWDGGSAYGNLGAGKTPYNSVGVYSGNWRTAMGFSSLPGGIVSITSAHLHFKTTGSVYTPFNGGTGTVKRCTESWTENNANNPLTTDPTVYPGPSTTTTNQATWSLGTAENVWKSVDITDIVKNWFNGTGQESWGVRLESSDGCTEIYGRESSYEPYIDVVYETNEKPSADTDSPAGSGLTAGSVVNPVPTYEGSFDDPDSGDEVTHIQIQVDTTAGFGSPIWDTVVNVPNANNDDFAVVYGGGTLHVRGTQYYWRVRATDDNQTSWGAWSSAQGYKYNSFPSATLLTPVDGGYAKIHNLLDTATTLTPKPQFTWDFSDSSGAGQHAYQVRIYSASSGGSLLYDSGKVISSSEVHNSTFSATRDTSYWVTLQVWDNSDESPGESGRSQFRCQYAQAIYEFAPTGGAASSGWKWANASMPANTEAAFLFRTATGASGAGAGSWVTSIGALVPNTYLNVMVRLQTFVEGVVPSLADMTFTYTAGAVNPDKWTLEGAGATMALDPDVRRFGAKSLKIVAGTADCLVRPTNDIAVQSSTQYTFSAFVKTNGVLTHGNLQLRVRRSGTSEDTTVVSGITDTGSSPQGWRRVQGQYTTASDETTVRPMLFYDGDGTAGESFWLDAVKFEEGAVATAWSPGFVGDPVILDSNGVQIDGLNGGILRARGSNGGARDTVELGPDGLRFGGDTDLNSPSAGLLAAEGRTLAFRESCLRAQRVTSDQSIPNDTGTTLIFNSIIREDDEDAAISLNTGTGVLTFSKAGWYLVEAGIRWGGSGTGVRHIFISHNGTTISRQSSDPDTTQWYLQVTTLLYAAASDTVEIICNQDSGGSLNAIASAHTHLGVARIRP